MINAAVKYELSERNGKREKERRRERERERDARVQIHRNSREIQRERNNTSLEF